MFDTDLDESIKWLKEREGFRPRPYSDYKQTSIGYGTGNTGLKYITEPQAADLLKNEIITRRSALGKDYPQGISNWAKLALDDRLYNAGVESVRKSKFLNALKGLDEDEAERQLYDWNKVNVGGKLVENEGLTNRVRDLGARRGPASETPRKYDTSKSPFTQSDIYANIKNDPAFNETKNRLSYLQQLEAAKKYKDDGFRMAGVEGGAQPVTSLDLNTLFSNDNPLFNVLPKVQTETIEKNIEPVSEQLPSMDEVNEPTQNSEGQPQQIEFGDNLAEGQPLDNNTMKMLNQLSSIDPNTVETVQPKTNEVDKYSNLLNMYNSLQKSRNLASETEDKKGLLQGMASAGSTIGAAIAGIKPDREGLKAAFSGDVNTLQQVDKRSEELQKYQKMIEEMKAGEFDQDYKNRYLQYLNDQLKSKTIEDQQNKKDKEALLNDKKMETAEKRFDTFMTKMNEDLASSRSDLGMNAKNIRVAQDIKALIEGRVDPEQFTNIELKEMAMAMNSLFSPTGVPSMRVTESLTPKTFKTELAKWIQYASGSPAAAKAGGFANMYGHIVDRQAEINLAQLKQKLVSAFAPYSQVEGIRKLPQTQAWMQTKGITDKDIEDALAGKFTKESLGKKMSEQSNETIRVKINGQIGSIPKANLEKAKSKYKDLEVL